MKGDFSRFGFTPDRSFSRVLIQQGRMTLDADANEQQHINLLALRALASDLIGRHGGRGDAFKLTTMEKGGRTHLMIGVGRYYVDGWMAENREPAGYLDVPGETASRVVGQPFHPMAEDLESGAYFAYLEVWERSVSAAELDNLSLSNAPEALREVALGGPDTAARAQLVWQVRLHNIQDGLPLAGGEVDVSDLDNLFAVIRPPQRGRLSAEAAKPPIESEDPCDVPPRSRYRGIENQLYRVEIAQGGTAAAQGGATFVWSRENGAVAFPVDTVSGATVKLADVWRDARFTIGIGDIVEVVSDASGLGEDASFHRVEDYWPDSATLTLDTPPIAQSGGLRRPLLVRRWDHGGKRKRGDGSPKMTQQHTLLIEEGKPLTIEQGITVEFEKPGANQDPNIYRPGDFWLIPARSALGDILWPETGDVPDKVPPHGVERHFAPLGRIEVAASGKPAVKKDLRNLFDPIAKPA